jgi:alginate O-acetyltransferase complex protein AlgI
MLFNSAEFIIFLTLVATILSVSRQPGYRMGVLLIAGAAFYAAWDPRFLPLLAAYTLIGWWAGRVIEATSNDARRRWIAGSAIAIFLTGLAFFKYTAFLVSSLYRFVGIEQGTEYGIILPLGISFFTFEAISYVMDVYRRDIRPPRSFWHFALFMSFFPRLVAGPIVRPREFLPQVAKPIIFFLSREYSCRCEAVLDGTGFEMRRS